MTRGGSTLSPSYVRIYAVVRRIPRGKVATYGQVADLAGMHGSARLVGYALYASKEHHGLPWHRVLAAGGRLSLVKLDPHSAMTQRIRLEHEGVRFTGRGTVDMAACQWAPGRPRTPQSKRAGRRRP
jgi:methylated-DNA-protein-cysteine methyltransferase-like protein